MIKGWLEAFEGDYHVLSCEIVELRNKMNLLKNAIELNDEMELPKNDSSEV